MGQQRGEFGDYDEDAHGGAAVENSNEFDQIRTRGRERLQYLAQHKEPKLRWWTCVGPTQSWGTQETIWPLNRATQSAFATPRMGQLAQPKKCFQTGDHVNRPLWQFSCGRTSQLSQVDDNAMRASASDRLRQLAGHKTYPQHTPNREEFMYSCGRVSPIWNITDTTLASGSGEPRPRTVDLSHPKRTHPQFQPERALPWEVSPTAKTHRTGERTQNLSEPKVRREGPFRDPVWMVSENAMNAVATPRCAELARAKALADGFQHAREIQWPVSKAARRANASGRLSDLAMPIQRVKMNELQFNPDAFQVKPLALKAHLSSRVAELATPIQR